LEAPDIHPQLSIFVYFRINQNRRNKAISPAFSCHAPHRRVSGTGIEWRSDTFSGLEPYYLHNIKTCLRRQVPSIPPPAGNRLRKLKYLSVISKYVFDCNNLSFVRMIRVKSRKLNKIDTLKGRIPEFIRYE